MGDEEFFVDVTTSEQLKTLLKAEEALGEMLVARVLRDAWTDENNDVWCWDNGCHRCDRELKEGEEGYIWARPLGGKPESTHCTLESYCSEECVDAAIRSWAAEFQRDLMIGYHTL